MRKTWSGIQYTVHVPVGTDKFMVTVVRTLPREHPKPLNVKQPLIERYKQGKDGGTTQSSAK